MHAKKIMKTLKVQQKEFENNSGKINESMSESVVMKKSEISAKVMYADLIENDVNAKAKGSTFSTDSFVVSDEAVQMEA